MSGRALNTVLLVAFVGTLALNWSVRRDPARPNREFIPEMVHTPRYNAFSPNANLPGGQTLQAPEPGTIRRGYLPLHYKGSPGDALRAGQELAAPFPADDSQVLARGAAVFHNFCQPCHGSAGAGDGPVILRGYPAPPSLVAEHARSMKEGQVFHVLTYGQGNMPAYASQLSQEDRWKVILFVRSLQKQPVSGLAGGRP